MVTGAGVIDPPPQPTARKSEVTQTQRRKNLGMGSCPTFIMILKRTVSCADSMRREEEGLFRQVRDQHTIGVLRSKCGYAMNYDVLARVNLIRVLELAERLTNYEDT